MGDCLNLKSRNIEVSDNSRASWLTGTSFQVENLILLKRRKIMKVFKSLLIALVILASFLVAQPSFADKPKFLKNPDYIEVTKALESLQATQQAQSQIENSNSEEIQQKIDELEFQ